ncbi:MAG: hypothetical protein JW788_04265, partial [Candidatus Omnitrophica bacterium]|nr:hypothetical protein [Candidatus Omnitrophota bacterium]
MADFYPYLISSLPMLNFGMKPPFLKSSFLRLCSEFIPDSDSDILRDLPESDDYAKKTFRHPITGKWVVFDVALRNALAKARASRKHIDATVYLRPGQEEGVFFEQIAQQAVRTPSVVEAEKLLDEARWKKLEELSTGHYFDVGFLITYFYK